MHSRSPLGAPLSARGLTVRHDDGASPIPIVDGLDLDVVPGAPLALVGENGAGKSSLLRVFAGIDRPAAGAVQAAPDRHFLSQRDDVADEDEDATAAGSPGQRKRRRLEAALVLRPTLLLLDEPTNHLDDDARGDALARLRRFAGALVIASHDRRLLEALCPRTLVLHRGTHLLVEAPPTVALSTWQATLNERLSARREAEHKAAQAAARLQAARAEHQAAEAQRSRRRRMKDKNDHDARNMFRQFSADRASARLGRSVHVDRHLRERADEAAAASPALPKALGRSFFWAHQAPRRAFVAQHHGPLASPAAGAPPLFGRVDVDVRPGARLRLCGENGAGKTTLLVALAASAVDPVLHLPQTLSEAQARALVRRLHDVDRAVRGRTLQAVAALGVDPERLLTSPQPSPGEAKKLALALAFAEGVAALFLDEPDNHLDLPSVERLTTALQAFPGALVLVCHDEDVVDAAGVEAELLLPERVVRSRVARAT